MKILFYLNVKQMMFLDLKFKHTKSEMLGLYVFSTFRGRRTYHNIEEFIHDKSKVCEYITNHEIA